MNNKRGRSPTPGGNAKADAELPRHEVHKTVCLSRVAFFCWLDVFATLFCCTTKIARKVFKTPK